MRRNAACMARMCIACLQRKAAATSARSESRLSMACWSLRVQSRQGGARFVTLCGQGLHLCRGAKEHVLKVVGPEVLEVGLPLNTFVNTQVCTTGGLVL